MAVTLTLRELGHHLRITDGVHDVPDYYIAILTDLLEAATELVEKRAPDAPTDTQNMAVARICAYLERGPEDAPARFGFNAWQNSGAAQLLGAHIIHRAEAV